MIGDRPAFTVAGVALLFWIALCIALIGAQTIFFRKMHTIDSDWWLHCVALAVVVLFSTIVIAIRRNYANERMLSYVMSGGVGSLIVFAFIGLLAGSLTQTGFVWIYLPIGIVPGALQGIVTYGALKKFGSLDNGT